jgi:endoglucanase
MKHSWSRARWLWALSGSLLAAACGSEATPPATSTGGGSNSGAGAPNPGGGAPNAAGGPSIAGSVGLAGVGGGNSAAGAEISGGAPNGGSTSVGGSSSMAGSMNGAGAAGDGSVRSAMQVIGDMGLGWNLGNTLDSLGVKDETGWGNPKTTQAMIDAVKKGGFKSLRLPTSWDDHFSGSNYTIDAAWLNRVEEVAKYALNDGMYVIVNVHHTNGWENTTAANEANAKDHLTKLWAQIATHFKGYDQHLIFETMNEPRSGDDWTGKQEYYDVVNRLNEAAVSTIRGTGGNNVTRVVMVPGYVASPQAMQINALKLPTDTMLAVSTHSYIPYSFALDSTGTASFSNTSEIDSAFSRLDDLFIKKGIPVVMGEWASTNKNNLSDRTRHATYYVKAAKNAGFPCFWWDNQNFAPNTSDAMGLFDRKALSWKFPELLAAINDGMK